MTKDEQHSDSVGIDSEVEKAQWGGSPRSQPQEIWDDLAGIAAESERLSVLIRSWLLSSAKLFRIESQLSARALGSALLCSILFVLLLVLFIFSLSVSVGIIIYWWTSQLPLAVLTALCSLGMSLILLIWRQNQLLRLVGYTHTKQQIKEGWDALTQAVEKGNRAHSNGE